MPFGSSQVPSGELSPAVAAINSTDLVSFVLGGVMAFGEANKAVANNNKLTQTSLQRSAQSLAWFCFLLFILLIGSYPSGHANAPWCGRMHSLVKLLESETTVIS